MAAVLVSHRHFLLRAAHGAVLFLAALLIVVFSLLSPPSRFSNHSMQGRNRGNGSCCGGVLDVAVVAAAVVG